MVSLICKKGYNIKVVSIDPGKYYRGAVNYNGVCPVCRLSDFADSPKRAAKLPINRQFYCKDNVDCNGGAGCFN